MRISREQMLMEWAHTAAKRGTCGRLAVGAVIARDSRPISSGYVGPEAGAMHCEQFGCDVSKPCSRTKHAERNAIEFSLKYGIDTGGADMFVTDSPCYECAQLIVGTAGIARVYFDREYRVTDGIKFLLDCKVEVWRVLPNGMMRRITSAA